MNISADGKVLAATTRELSRKWQETRHYWQDEKSEEFERRFLAELCAVVERTAPVFDRLEKLIGLVRNQCE